MIIVIVEFDIAPVNQPSALKVFAQDENAARGMAGCEAFTVAQVAGSETGMILVEEWASMGDFETYKASAGFARVGKALGQMMLSAPRSRTFEASIA